MKQLFRIIVALAGLIVFSLMLFWHMYFELLGTAAYIFILKELGEYLDNTKETKDE